MNDFYTTSDMYAPTEQNNKLTKTLKILKDSLETTEAFKVKDIKTTKFSVQIEMRKGKEREWVKVDILPACDNLGDGYAKASKILF